MNPRLREAIQQMVPYGSRVLDLGCGDGALLAFLQQHHGCTGYGVEIDDANVLACVKRGVNVIQLNLEQGLAMFGDQSFDVVLQIDTLQHLRNAQTMLQETVRVGRLRHRHVPQFCALAQPFKCFTGLYACDAQTALPVV
jgi:methionine biosynthesis protein MetW